MSTILEPQQILNGRYEILREIGKGAQARTYLARDQQRSQDVVVKQLILLEAEDWKAIELFERESKVLRQLRHDSIPEYIDDFYEAGLGSYILVQEYIEGKSLQTYIDTEKHWTLQEICELGVQACEVLMYLHELHPPVVHRDIKPSNIMLTPKNKLVLIDFGGVQTVSQVKETGGSTVVGTSGYMPPEQLIGRATPQSDLYALGVTLVHLMSRAHPTELPVVRMQLQIQDALRGTKSEMVSLLERLLSPMPEDRVVSARVLLREFQEILSPSKKAREQQSKNALGHRTENQPKPTPVVKASAPSGCGCFGWMALVVVLMSIVINLYECATDVCDGYCYSKGQELEKSTVSGEPEKAIEMYKYGCDYKHETESCSQLGYLYLNGIVVKKDYEESKKYSKKACEKSNAMGCTNYGVILEEERLGFQNKNALAFDYYRKGCEFGSEVGCNNAGVLLEDGIGVHQDYVKAAEYYQKSCYQGYQKACGSLGWLYFEGLGVAQNYARAVLHLRTACDANQSYPCNNLGVAYENGYAVERNAQKAFEFYQKSCELGATLGCTNLGYSYEFGSGVAQDVAKAKTLYEENCEKKDKAACRRLARMYSYGKSVAKDKVKAFQLFDKACTLGDMSACSDLGYAYANGEGVAENKDKAFELYKKACDGGHDLGCNNLGSEYEHREEFAKAFEFYEKACNDGEFLGCSNLGDLYRSGKYDSKDELKAVTMYQKACDGEDGKGCSQLGLFYEEGIALSKDLRKSAEFYKKACENESRSGCRALARFYSSGLGGLAKDAKLAQEARQKACEFGATELCESK